MEYYSYEYKKVMENYDINIKVYSTEFTNENKGIFCRIIMSIKKRRLPFPISLNIIIFNSTELKKKEKGAAYIIMYVTPNIYVASKLSDIKKAHCIS